MGTVSVEKMREFWRWTVVIVAQQCECTECRRTVHLEVVKMVNFILCIFYHNF